MKLLHLTPKKNWNSITKYGLIPNKPTLDHHIEAFQNGGLIGDKVVYCWEPGETSTDKMVKDFIYCKHFINPRNKIITDYYDNNIGEEPDMLKLGSRLFGEAQDWVLLEIDTEGDDLLDDFWIHSQLSGGDGGNSCFLMNSLYEHDDKILKIGHSIINKNKFKIVSEISTRLYKDDTIGVSYKKVK